LKIQLWHRLIPNSILIPNLAISGSGCIGKNKSGTALMRISLNYLTPAQQQQPSKAEHPTQDIIGHLRDKF